MLSSPNRSSQPAIAPPTLWKIAWNFSIARALSASLGRFEAKACGRCRTHFTACRRLRGGGGRRPNRRTPRSGTSALRTLSPTRPWQASLAGMGGSSSTSIRYTYHHSGNAIDPLSDCSVAYILVSAQVHVFLTSRCGGGIQ